MVNTILVNSRTFSEQQSGPDAQPTGMSEWEYTEFVTRVGRAPTEVEQAVVHSLWSEHCSYKSSRIHFHHFPSTGTRSIVRSGENAGALDIGSGWAVVFKIESHNHPSFIEPFQGAMTGVGGILRDVFTMGARPFALLNSLRFGDLSLPLTCRLVREVVAGIGAYGNCVGIPTVGGQVAFDPAFSGNNLVNVFCIGLVRHKEIVRGAATGVGNIVILLGSLTGKDGVLGAVMASASFGDSITPLRPTVQVGDPLMGKQLMECCLALCADRLVVGAQDLGAAGLSSAAFELAARGETGILLHLDDVPVRTAPLTAREILLSESQERMLLVVEKKRWDKVQTICQHFDVPATVVGVVTDTERVEARFLGETVLNLPVQPIVSDPPLIHRPYVLAPPCKTTTAPEEPARVSVSTETALLNMLSHPDFASKQWIYEQFDSTVGNRTAIGPGSGTAVMWVPDNSTAIALSLTCDSHYCASDPYLGSFHAVLEGAREVTCVGAAPIGISDNLNFGDPTNPETMGQLVESIRGIGDACRALQIPVCSGNVSLFNQTGDVAILPTPTIAMVGILDQPVSLMRPGWKNEGDIIAVIGSTRTDCRYLNSYSRILFGNESDSVPPIDVETELTVMRTVRECIRNGWLQSVSTCTSGGLLPALTKETFQGEIDGFRITLPPNLDPTVALFGEGSGRFVVSISPHTVSKVQNQCFMAQIDATIIGWVQRARLVVVDHLDVPCEHIKNSWRVSLEHRLARGTLHGR